MPAIETQAQALLRGDCSVAARLARSLLRPLPGNFVERPWGGAALREFKAAGPRQAPNGTPLGEAFEIAAFDADPEARTHPSRLGLDDGSAISLPQLLSIHGPEILGARFVERFGACYPLLPKLLDIKELLSVQGHPAGNTEAYIVIEAEPGATIRLGFAEDVDARALQAELSAGLRDQQTLLRLLGEGVDQQALQHSLQPWLAGRDAALDDLAERLPRGDAADPQSAGLGVLLAALKRCYWRMLDRMNVIPVHAGQIIHNATPRRLLRRTGRLPAAEVHALGNPEGREILALEVRRPGPTFRAWDNVRFPVRNVDVGAAIGALNLLETDPSEFIVTPAPIAGRPGVACSVDSEYFRLEHLEPREGVAVAVPAEAPHSLHVLAGAVHVYNADGEELAAMARGESAIVPQAVGAYRVAADESGARVVKVSLPASD